MTIPPDVCLLAADYGIGDHYIVAAFADAVRRQFDIGVWMAGRANLAFIANLFPAIEHYVESEPGRAALPANAWKIEGGQIFYAHFPELELMRAVGYNGFHFLDAYRCRLGLPATAFMSRPHLPSGEELAAAVQLLSENGFAPGRTVVLSVEARSTPTDGVTAEFWIALAAALQGQGLQALVNAGPSTVVPTGMRALALPLTALRAVAESAGFFCSVRSGLSDLVCDLRCPQVVVYPDVRWWAGSLYAGATFTRFGLKKVPFEVVLNPARRSEQIRTIVSHFEASAFGVRAFQIKL